MNTTIAELDKQDSYFGNEATAEGGPSRKLDIKIQMSTQEHETTMVQTLPLTQPSVAA
jgi:hypothetical protein